MSGGRSPFVKIGSFLHAGMLRDLSMKINFCLCVVS